MNNAQNNLLSQIAFSILFALSLKPRHGYELMQQIAHDSGGRLRLGPGSLYGTIKTLSEDNLIEEVPFAGGERRRYYRLTKKGWDRLNAEMAYYKEVVRLAEDRRINTQLGAIGWHA